MKRNQVSMLDNLSFLNWLYSFQFTYECLRNKTKWAGHWKNGRKVSLQELFRKFKSLKDSWTNWRKKSSRGSFSLTLWKPHCRSRRYQSLSETVCCLWIGSLSCRKAILLSPGDNHLSLRYFRLPLVSSSVALLLPTCWYLGFNFIWTSIWEMAFFALCSKVKCLNFRSELLWYFTVSSQTVSFLLWCFQHHSFRELNENIRLL